LRNFLSLTLMRIRLTLRNKTFMFFGVIMPFGFFFLFAGVFAKGDPVKVRFLLGSVLSLAVMGAFWGLSVALVTFREQGILRRFHVTPASATDMLVSSILANYALTLPTVLVELFLARFLFHVPSLGDFLSLFLLISLGTMSFGSLGLVIASVTNTMQETQVLNQLLWLPLIFLSGATIPFTYLSKTVQSIALFLPATYLVHGLKRAIVDAAGPTKLGLVLGSLAIWFALTLFLSSQIFRWEPEAKIPRKAKLLVAATAIPFFLLGIWEAKDGRVIAEETVALQRLNAEEKAEELQKQQQQNQSGAASEKSGKPDDSKPQQ
jgi:ABC-type transport system involved in cytochrome c biogenesis permease component